MAPRLSSGASEKVWNGTEPAQLVAVLQKHTAATVEKENILM